MTRLATLLLAAALLAILPGCDQPDANATATQASAPRTQLPAYGRFVAVYLAPQTAALRDVYKQAKQARWLDEVVHSLNTQFRLPRDIDVATAECGVSNAFFDPEAHSITLCYELIVELQQQALAQKLPTAEQDAYLQGVLSFVFMHELGHALIHELALPATGREEDVADQLAVVSLLGEPDTDSVQVFANSVAQIGHVAAWLQLNASGEYDMEAMADSHALDEQRFYNVMCWLYGAQPDSFDDMIVSGQLPAERAEGCADEYRQIRHSWDSLLAPHLLAQTH